MDKHKKTKNTQYKAELMEDSLIFKYLYEEYFVQLYPIVFEMDESIYYGI